METIRERQRAFVPGLRAGLPTLLGVVPFGLITGVAVVGGGIDPFWAIAMSLVVFAGASMIAATQLLADATPAALVITTTLVINLRFMMYSASLRPFVADLPLRWRLLIGYLLADNPYAVSVARFSEHSHDANRLAFYLGVAVPVWFAWQAAFAAGALLGAGLPVTWRLEFAAPLVFIAMSVPLLRDRASVAAALAAGTVMVVGHDLPFRLAILCAAVAGISAGLLVERRPA